MSLFQNLAAQFIFLMTGIVSTCLTQVVFYQGAGDQRAMLLPLANYLGMMMVGLIPDGGYSGILTKASCLLKSKRKKIPLEQLKQSLHEGHDSERKSLINPAEPVTKVEMTESIEVGDNKQLNERLLTRRVTLEDNPPEEAEKLIVQVELGKEGEEVLRCRFSMPSVLRTFVAGPRGAQRTLSLTVGLMVILDFSGFTFCNLGLMMAGSGIYQVAYSSIVCWSAGLSKLFLDVNITKEQVVGIMVVTIGLAISAFGEAQPDEGSKLILLGILNTLMGAGMFAGNYVVGEFAMRLPDHPSAKEFCVRVGSICVGIIGVYMMFFSVPRWQELIVDNVAQQKGSTPVILLAFSGIIISQLAHSITYYILLGSVGAVSTGILQSLRAVGVFITSSFFFCSVQSSQCYTLKRGVATLVVICGVLFYSWAKAQVSKGGKPRGSPIVKNAEQPETTKRRTYVL